jgi:adenosine deaminase
VGFGVKRQMPAPRRGGCLGERNRDNHSGDAMKVGGTLKARNGMRHGGLAAVVAALLLVGGCAGIMPAPTPAPEPIRPRIGDFDAIRNDPVKLEAFLREFPKGADLHNHLSGAVYAESFIAWAIADGLCIDKEKLSLARAPCTAGLVPASAARDDKALYQALVRSFSMAGFTRDGESGHDHFFASFNKFDAAEDKRESDMLAEALQRAAADHVLYLELMWSPGMPEARRLGAKVGWDKDLRRLRGKLLAAGLDGIVADVRESMDEREHKARTILACDNAALRKPGCDVTVRYLAQIIRVYPPVQVFAQDLLGFRLVESDPRFVGVNIVGPEDDLTSLHDYTLHMHMFALLHEIDPTVPMSLHAGELAEGLQAGLRRIGRNDLRFHIREAVEIAGARRIGHGVDIMQEDRPAALMQEMAARRILVEINLTSNDLILRVRGNAHPFMAYRRAGVPTALSTDDEGVERIDLTHEYVRAARDYHLSYADLKSLSRNSLSYAFLPGASLWRDNAAAAPVYACATDPIGAEAQSAPCATFLRGSEKARLQWQLEAAFARFEAR